MRGWIGVDLDGTRCTLLRDGRMIDSSASVAIEPGDHVSLLQVPA